MSILLALFYTFFSYAENAYGASLSYSDFDPFTEKMSHTFSLNTALHSTHSGQGFDAILTGVYQDLSQSSFSVFDPDKNHILTPLISLRKGLYWNLEFSISSLLPLSTDINSGYSIGINHSSKFGPFYFKPEVYLFQYTINDAVSLSGAGATLIIFTKIYSFDLGFGANFESVNGTYHNIFLAETELRPLPERSNKINSIISTARLSYNFKKIRLTGSYNYKDRYKNDAALSITTFF